MCAGIVAGRFLQSIDTARTYATDVLSNIWMSFTDRSVNHWVDGASS